MRRLLLPISLVLLSLCVSLPACAALAHSTCSGTCDNSNTSTSSLTLPPSSTLTFTTGHLLWVVARAGTGRTINVPTDTLSNTFHCLAAQSSSGSVVRGCYAYNITGGSDTITVTTDSSTNLHIVVDEYSGEATACDPIDGSQVTGNTSSGTTVTTSSLTTTGTDGLLAGTGLGGNTGTWTHGTNYLQRATVNPGRAAIEDQLNVTAGSYTATQSWAGTTDGVIIMVAIRQTCSTPTKPPIVLSLLPRLLFWRVSR